MSETPLVSEERIAELAGETGGRRDYIERAIRTAIREAGEAAAKVCEARRGDGRKIRRGDESVSCAAEIRKRL